MNLLKTIEVEHAPEVNRLNALGACSWPIWEKEISEFQWYYDEQEICLILEGDVIVTPDSSNPIHFGKGDLVTFPQGMSCTWKILKSVRKHYKFG